MGKQRLAELDLAKGLAIFLVVFGHLVTGPDPLGNSWYVTLKVLVYEFHMPFFMFLSGAVFQVTFRASGNFRTTLQFITSRVQRLLPAFVLFSAVIWAGKHAASQFLVVNNFDSRGFAELIEIYLSPSTSVARSLWYIYVLLELYVLFAIVKTLTRGRLLPAFFLAALLRALYQFAQVPTTLAANLLCEYAIFFVIGMALARSFDVVMPWLKDRALLLYCVFACSFLSMMVLPHPWTKAIIGLASLPAVLVFASSFTSTRDQSALRLLGEYTFTIYLMNTLFIGFFKGIMLKFIPWDGLYFVLHFFVLLTMGVLGPIAVHRLIFTRIPPLARITK
jgi:fucose 4-O-acetylase-like acetyltransferase